MASRQPRWLQQYSFAWRKATKKLLLRERFQLELVWQSERVWCVTSSTGYVIIRRNGKVAVVGNSIGFDYPELANVVLARPSMSLAVYYQQVGRAVRAHSEKSHAMIVDMVGLSNQFGKVEDLTLYENGGKWFVASGDRQLTNVYFGERDG